MNWGNAYLERVIFGSLKLVILGARGILGRNNVSARSMADYVVDLIDQQRFSQVRGLLRHTLLKVWPRKRWPQTRGAHVPSRKILSAEHMAWLIQPDPRTPAKPNNRALLVVVPHLSLGGAEILLLTILQRLKHGWQIVIVTTRPETHTLAPAFAALTGDIFHLPEILEEASWYGFVQQLMEVRGVTHVLSSGSTWGLVNLARLKRTRPGLKHIHLIHNEVPDTPFRTALALKASVDRFAVVSSQVSAALMTYGVAREQIAEIRNGVDASGQFDPGQIDARRTRREAGLDGRPILLWVGRLGVEKRPLLFLDVAEAVAARLDVQVVIVGTGPLLEPLRARVASGSLADRATLITNMARDKLAGYYAMADMLVLTSEVEGMPLVVLEALAMGCPVAATRVGDIACVVETGRNGLLVESRRCMEMVGPLAEALATGRYAGERGQIRASFCATLYLEHKMLDAYEEMFETV